MPILLPIRDDDHMRGDPLAPITLVEFGDYECPDCGEAYWIIREIAEKMGPRLRFVFRHYAFARLHPHAELAAQAAEAAGAQNKFWEMHDTLFENQSALKKKDLNGYAARIGLDPGRFAAELDSETHLEKVRGDFRTGVQNGVYGTPSLFINGVRHNGDFRLPTLLPALNASREMIDEAK